MTRTIVCFSAMSGVFSFILLSIVSFFIVFIINRKNPPLNKARLLCDLVDDIHVGVHWGSVCFTYPWHRGDLGK